MTEFEESGMRLVGAEIEVASNGFMLRLMYENPELQKYEKITARSIEELLHILRARLENE